MSALTAHERYSLRCIAKKTGAVCYETQRVVGDGPEPKLEVLRWAKRKATFASCISVPMMPSFTLTPPEAATQLETEPSLEHSELLQDHRGFRVAPQLPRIVQPVVPLVYGTLKGWPFYAEFLFAWEEKGNGEACQLGVSIGKSAQTNQDRQAAVQLKFSPSAGAMFQQRPEGSFRTWPMEDLWVDAHEPGTQTFLEAGVYISSEGQIAFYRKGPYMLDRKGDGARQLTWEVAGGFECQFPDSTEQFHEFHVVLCLLDEQTPLQAKILKIGSRPPIPPVAMPLARQIWVPETHIQRVE